MEEIQQNVVAGLIAILGEDFQRCFQQWKNCWRKCVGVEGQHFEGN
jgi:hypothetical protein